MGELARVEVEQRGDACVVRILGEVDVSNAEEVGALLDSSVDNLSMVHVVDLSDTAYLDSVGVRLLFSLAERLRARRRDLHVVVPEGAVIRRVLLLADLPRLATLHASLQEVLGTDG